MDYTQFEVKTWQKINAIKTSIVLPIVKVLAWLRIKPDYITFACVVLMAVYVYFVKTNIWIAFWLVVAQYVLDSFDGSLARFLKIDSDQGKFTDVVADNISYSLLVVGLVHAGLLAGIWGAMLVYVMLLARVLTILKKSVKIKSDWLFKPHAGLYVTAFHYAMYTMFGIYVLFGINQFKILAIVSIAMLAGKALFDFFRIRYLKKNEN